MLRKVIRTFVAVSFMLTSVIPGMAQAEHPLPHPQARTPQEFDLYLEFLGAISPEIKHAVALRFERVYPKSELLINVYESEFEYYLAHEQRQDAITASERALRLDPNNARVLLDLAEVLPYATNDKVTLSRAEEYARKAMVELKHMRFSQDVPISSCESMRSTLLAQTHAALGDVLGKRGELGEAIKELETAIAISPEPSGSELLLAGKLYRLAERDQEAMNMFRRAAEAGPTAVTLRANSELSEMWRGASN
jgi:tetratricopeptide (TPR) repeat protein